MLLILNCLNVCLVEKHQASDEHSMALIKLKAEFSSLKKADAKKIEELQGECGEWKGRWTKKCQMLAGMKNALEILEKEQTEQKHKITKGKEQIETQATRIKLLEAQLAAKERKHTQVLEGQVKTLLDDVSRLKAQLALVYISFKMVICVAHVQILLDHSFTINRSLHLVISCKLILVLRITGNLKVKRVLKHNTKTN